MIHYLGTSFAVTNLGMLLILLVIARNHLRHSDIAYTLDTGVYTLKQGGICGSIVGIILFSIGSNLLPFGEEHQQQVLSIIMTLWFVLVLFSVGLKETKILLTTLICGTIFNSMLLLGILCSQYHTGILVTIGIHGVMAFLTFRMLTSSRFAKG